MANNDPSQMSSDVSSTELVALSEAPSVSGPTSSVWRTEWRWVALAWVGGLLIGGTFLLMSFSLGSSAEIATVAMGGVFLIVAPGSYATWQTWRGHVRSRNKGQGQSHALESRNG